MTQMEKNVETIVDHGTIRTTADLNKLNIIDWTRYRPYWENPQQCLEAVTNATQGMIYSVIETSLDSFPQRDDFPGWRHTGNHEEVGKDFWNYFHFCFNGSLYFDDSPDFSGIIFYNEDDYLHKRHGIKERQFSGDVGRVSPIAIMDSSRTFSAGAYWISVADDCSRLTVLETPLRESDTLKVVRKKLTPILVKSNSTAHIIYDNVFVEHVGKNLYIGNQDEIAVMSQPQIKERVTLALSGEWMQLPVPCLDLKPNIPNSDFRTKGYTALSLWG